MNKITHPAESVDNNAVKLADVEGKAELLDGMHQSGFIRRRCLVDDLFWVGWIALGHDRVADSEEREPLANDGCCRVSVTVQWKCMTVQR